MNDINIKFYEKLKKERTTKKISLKEISEYTKINLSYLESLENGDFNVLPNVYVRLFLRSYCIYIGIDYKKILDEHEIHTMGSKHKKEITELPSTNEKDLELPSSDLDPLKKSKDQKQIIITVVVLTIIIFLFVIIKTLN